MPNQSPTTACSITARLSSDTLVKLEEIARLQNRSHTEIIQDAVDGYLNALPWFENEVRRGLKDLEEGRRISHEDLKEKYKRLGLDVD